METIYLSKRNLLTLLSKLERQEAGDTTACTIIKYRQGSTEFLQTMDSVAVTAVSDDTYYAALQRDPGEVHPLDTPS